MYFSGLLILFLRKRSAVVFVPHARTRPRNQPYSLNVSLAFTQNIPACHSERRWSAAERSRRIPFNYLGRSATGFPRLPLCYARDDPAACALLAIAAGRRLRRYRRLSRGEA